MPDWHRNDPPDDFEMNRNNVIYTWQFNRNPFIDQPDLVEYIWGDNVGDVWMQPLGLSEVDPRSVKIFPNPTTNRLYVKGLSGETRVQISTIEGRQIKSVGLGDQNFIDLGLAPGIYLLRIINGENSLFRKVIVK